MANTLQKQWALQQTIEVVKAYAGSANKTSGPDDLAAAISKVYRAWIEAKDDADK